MADEIEERNVAGMSSPRAELLAGTRERRSVNDFTLTPAGKTVEFRGYAAVFDVPYEVEDRYGKFTEVVDRRAFERTLNANPDVVLNVDHEGLPLARTTSGTLELATDSHGLVARAQLEPRDPDVERVMYKMQRGDMAEMSFSFRAIRDVWSANEERRLNEVSIDGGDVCITPTGFNRATTASIRSATAALADFDKMLVEARSQSSSIDIDELRAAYGNLGRLLHELSPRKTLSVKAAERTLLLT